MEKSQHQIIVAIDLHEEAARVLSKYHDTPTPELARQYQELMRRLSIAPFTKHE